MMMKKQPKMKKQVQTQARTKAKTQPKVRNQKQAAIGAGMPQNRMQKRGHKNY